MKIGELLNIGIVKLKENAIDSYILDSQILLAHVLEKNKLYIIINKDIEVDKEKEDVFLKFIKERAENKPIKYITKQAEFMGFEFFVDKGVLIPRPETEALVEMSLDYINRFNYKKVLDLCAGSGAIGLSIAKLANVEVALSDISDKAIEVSRINKKKLNIDNANIVKSDLLNEFIKNKDKYDIIVSNPPYIEKAEIDNLMEDVKCYEPYEALCGGEDGLLFYKKIIKDSTLILNKGGLILFEIGYNQGDEVKNLLLENKFSSIDIVKDLAGLDRIVVGVFR
ncbi:MAG: peptide chain release factor N(5)-glutamine methyltransferase [Clostridiaceae bacterium]